MMRWLLALMLLVSSPASAEVHRVDDDHGGIVIEYIAKYVAWDKAKDTVIVEGACVSACTIMLGIIDNDKMCATKNAEFGFHSAVLMPYGLYTEEGTRLLWFFYQRRVRKLLLREGWESPTTPHPELIYIDAQELIRPCTFADYHEE